MIDPKRTKVGSPVVFPATTEQKEIYWISGLFRSFVENGIWPTNYASVSSTDKRIQKNEILVELGKIYALPPEAFSGKIIRGFLWKEFQKTPDCNDKQKDIGEILDSWDNIKSNYNRRPHNKIYKQPYF